MTLTIEKALLFAFRAHEGQFRKKSGMPYIIHPITIASKFNNTNLKILALWHDIFEDCPEHDLDVTCDLYKVSYPLRVSLGLLTHKSSDTYLEYILKIKIDEMATKVKIEDLKHNLIDPLSKCQEDKYLMALYILETKI